MDSMFIQQDSQYLENILIDISTTFNNSKYLFNILESLKITKQNLSKKG